ncbi:unnamed protein product [Rotaria socialis]|uniref:Uncharacterized protein n=1 Tax=Rotaria socialis TaxID=392032 RepID=A0A820CA94_9BILA|nr:unnamed protein product [Rotaria socialis]CAF4219165.1 unnamed protein product [Rotaria socialis]
MEFQPNDSSDSTTTTTDELLALEQVFFHPEDFTDAFNDLPIGINQVTIEDQSSTNMENLEVSLPNQNTNVEIERGISDMQDNQDDFGSSSYPHINRSEEAAIANNQYDSQNAINESSSIINSIQNVVDAIYHEQNPAIRITTQPAAKQRFRYRREGTRYQAGSRSNPTCIELPILYGCLQTPDQSLWLEATLVTTTRNPQRKRFVHEHEMSCTEENVEQIGLHSFRIRLTNEEVCRRRKTIRHVSITKTKQRNYSFLLTPYDPSMEDNNVEHYTLPNEDRLTKVQKSKRFDRAYHTNEYQILFQLMIRQNDRWYMTPIYCETHVVRNA